MPSDCRPRSSTVKSSPPITRFIIPETVEPIDELFRMLADQTNSGNQELILNAMELLNRSQCARDYIEATVTHILAVVSESTDSYQHNLKLTYTLELAMSIGLLTGSAIGFRVGEAVMGEEWEDVDGGGSNDE